MDTALTLPTDMALVLGMVVLNMLLFLFERVRADVVALVVLVVIALTGVAAPAIIFRGFSWNVVMSWTELMISGLRMYLPGGPNPLPSWLARRFARGDK